MKLVGKYEIDVNLKLKNRVWSCLNFFFMVQLVMMVKYSV